MRLASVCAVAVAVALSHPLSSLCKTASRGSLCDSADRLPGKYLKWIIVAEPVFRRNHLKLDRYNIKVEEETDSGTGKEAIVVLLIATDAACEGFGSTGSVPDFEVVIDKKSGNVLRFNYEK